MLSIFEGIIAAYDLSLSSVPSQHQPFYSTRGYMWYWTIFKSSKSQKPRYVTIKATFQRQLLERIKPLKGAVPDWCHPPPLRKMGTSFEKKPRVACQDLQKMHPVTFVLSTLRALACPFYLKDRNWHANGFGFMAIWFRILQFLQEFLRNNFRRARESHQSGID